jgi:hypothetical protein
MVDMGISPVGLKMDLVCGEGSRGGVNEGLIFGCGEILFTTLDYS